MIGLLDFLSEALAPEAHFDCSINGIEFARAPAVRSDSLSDKIEFENIIDHQIASPKLFYHFWSFLQSNHFSEAGKNQFFNIYIPKYISIPL